MEKKERYKAKHLPRLFWEAAKIWNKHKPWRLSAVVAYYAVLALPGLLIIIINVVGAIWGNEIVKGEITSEISEAIGFEAANSLIGVIENTHKDSRTFFATIIGIWVLLFGATGVFYHLQISMNEIWNVKINPDAGFWKILRDRALSLAFLMAIAFLLIVSFVISTALTLLSKYLSYIWDPAYVVFARLLDFVFSTGILSLLFVLIFKFMPDMKVMWRSVWLGGIFTALLFNLGKTTLSIYFGYTEPGSTYGAAGSVVLVLLWVSYSCLILFYGAAFTRAYAERYHPKVLPEDYAMIVKEKEIIVEKGTDSQTE
jgi:membrane protein